ncbi:MAG: glutamate racemase, partial [Cyanobacteria bacterium J06650_10]
AKHLTVAAAQELKILRLRRPADSALPSSTEFYVSGDPEQFANVSQQWLGFKPQVSQVGVSTLEVIHAASTTQTSDR